MQKLKKASIINHSKLGLCFVSIVPNFNFIIIYFYNFSVQRRPCLRVSRTVEMVNQTDDSWRDEKSKLMFMLSLGLTPKPQKPGTLSLENKCNIYLLFEILTIILKFAAVISPKIKLQVIRPELLSRVMSKVYHHYKFWIFSFYYCFIII